MSGETVFLEAVAEGVPADLQQPRGFGLVAGGPLQGVHERLPLDILEGVIGGGARSLRGMGSVVEGMENINEYVYEPKLHEQLKFASRTGHMFEPWQILISEITWKKMSEVQRKVVTESAVIAWKQQREAQAARNLEFENKLKEAGMKFNDINRDVLRTATDSVRQKLAAKVSGGQELVTSILNAR